MIKFNVKAQVIHYVNGNPKKAMMVEQPYIYSTGNKAFYVKSNDINNTVMTIMCQHDKKQIEKELRHLRVLVDTSGKEKLSHRHKNMLDYLGIDDLECLLREDNESEDDSPTIFMGISVFTIKKAEKEKAILDSISFRFMSDYPNRTNAVDISDWYVIDAKSKTYGNTDNVDDIKSEDKEVPVPATPKSDDNQPWTMNFVMSETPINIDRFYQDIAQCLEVLRCRAMLYISNDFDPSIKDANLLAGILDNMKNVIYRRNIFECCGIDAEDTPQIELEVRRVYKMALKFLQKIEELKTVEKDFFVLLGEATLALNLRDLCRRLTFRESNN